jgi:hypothetical protein
MDADAVERLETWMLDGGYITTANPLSRDEIRQRVLANAASDIEQRLFTPDDVNEILAQLPSA